MGRKVDKMAKKQQSPEQAPNAGREEQIGFHKGSLATLAKERSEMLRILQIVEQLMQMHIKGLKDLGIDLEQEAKKIASSQQQPKEKKPIEDIIR
ncbi:hypothetical protein HYU14_02885 [Candidatus Woesearchaeota archaeon]|nr:hypothetical protein [Candidatus Woesearchaeota archaeon]